MHFSDVNGTEDDTFVEINNGNADEDEGKDNSDQPDVLPLSRVLFIVCVVYHFFLKKTFQFQTQNYRACNIKMVFFIQDGKYVHPTKCLDQVIGKFCFHEFMHTNLREKSFQFH